MVGRRWGDGGRWEDGGKAVGRRWGDGEETADGGETVGDGGRREDVGEDLGGVSIQFVNGQEDDFRTREVKRWEPVWGKR